MWVVASGIGPVLGGVLTEKASWRWIWWIILPCSGIAFAVLLVFLRLPPSRSATLAGIKSIDWLGSLSILGVTVMLLLGLQFGGTSFPWTSPKVICLLVFGFGMISTFLFCEVKVARYPVMPLGLFQKRSNVAALLVCFFHGYVSIILRYYFAERFDEFRRRTFPPSISFLSMCRLWGVSQHCYRVFSSFP